MQRFREQAEHQGTEIITADVQQGRPLGSARSRSGCEDELYLAEDGDHRDRRARQLPRPPERGDAQEQGRERLRGLRRRALPQPGRGRRRRRRHRDGGGDVPLRPLQARSRSSTAATSSAPRRRCWSASSRTRRSRSSTATSSTRCSTSRRTRSPASRVKNLKTGETHDVPVGAMFVAIGHTPMTELFVGQLELAPERLHQDGARHDAHQRPRRVRRGRRAGLDLPPSRHRGGHRLHGRARRRALPRAH